jgi:hypothetical protein
MEGTRASVASVLAPAVMRRGVTVCLTHPVEVAAGGAPALWRVHNASVTPVQTDTADPAKVANCKLAAVRRPGRRVAFGYASYCRAIRASNVDEGGANLTKPLESDSMTVGRPARVYSAADQPPRPLARKIDGPDVAFRAA